MLKTIAVSFAAGALIATGATMWTAGKLWESAKLKAERAAYTAQVEGYESQIVAANLAVTQYEKEIEDEREENTRLSRQLNNARAALSRKYQPIQDEIPTVIPQCPDTGGGELRYGRDFVRVFNASATAGTNPDSNASEADTEAAR